MKIRYAVLTPKHEAAIKKLDYHGTRWLYRGQVEALKFTRDSGPFIILVSRDGKKCLHIKKTDDKDYTYHLLD